MRKCLQILKWCELCTKKPECFSTPNKSKFVKYFNDTLEMLNKLKNKFSRVIARFENIGNLLRAKKSSSKATVFTQEKMNFSQWF